MVVHGDPEGFMEIPRLVHKQAIGSPWKVHGMSMESSWKSKVAHGNPWKSMESHGNPMKSVETHGDPWKPMAFHRNPWKSMEVYRNPWKSMQTYGNQWKPIENNGDQFQIDCWNFVKCVGFAMNFENIYHSTLKGLFDSPPGFMEMRGLGPDWTRELKSSPESSKPFWT